MVYQTVVYQTLRSVIPTGLLPLLRSGSPLRRPTFRLRARRARPPLMNAHLMKELRRSRRNEVSEGVDAEKNL